MRFVAETGIDEPPDRAFRPGRDASIAGPLARRVLEH